MPVDVLSSAPLDLDSRTPSPGSYVSSLKSLDRRSAQSTFVMALPHAVYAVDRLLKRRLHHGQVQYLVRWTGYGDTSGSGRGSLVRRTRRGALAWTSAVAVAPDLVHLAAHRGAAEHHPRTCPEPGQMGMLGNSYFRDPNRGPPSWARLRCNVVYLRALTGR